MNMQINSAVALSVPVPTKLSNDHPKSFEWNLDRPLYVKGDSSGNLVSLAIIVGMSAVIAPLLYVAIAFAIDFSLLTRLSEAMLV